MNKAGSKTPSTGHTRVLTSDECLRLLKERKRKRSKSKWKRRKKNGQRVKEETQRRGTKAKS